MWFVELLLWPGTRICEMVGVDPASDAGLMRWMINTLIYTVVLLIAVAVFAV